MFKFLVLVLLPIILLAQPNTINRAIEALFGAIDINNDKSFVEIEFLGYFLSFDRNDDGVVSHTEFNRAIDHASLGFFGHENKIYSAFDADKSGNLTRVDLEEAFARADSNNDTRVNDREFHRFINDLHIIIG